MEKAYASSMAEYVESRACQTKENVRSNGSVADQMPESTSDSISSNLPRRILITDSFAVQSR